MHGKGAKVTSFDFSRKMVEVAERKTKGLDIEIFQADFQDLKTINDNYFDIVISNMVIHDLPDHTKAINEAYRVLKHGGVFVFAILHPCFDTPGSGWIRDDEGNKLFWKVTKYFEQGRFDQASSVGSSRVLMFHRTLSSYFKTLRQCGFIVDEMVEPEPTSAAIEAHSDFINYKNMCHFLLFKAIK